MEMFKPHPGISFRRLACGAKLDHDRHMVGRTQSAAVPDPLNNALGDADGRQALNQQRKGKPSRSDGLDCSDAQ